MNNIAYIFSSLRARWLGSILAIMLTAFGVAMALTILMFTHHVQTRADKDSQNIDLVIGAKGSPLQIILSSIYHIDIPTGNIDWNDAQKWIKHPHVKNAIPLALGDNWKGTRIIGTTHDYMDLFQAQIKSGVLWHQTFEVVIGSDVKLNIGDMFVGSHGLSNGGHAHDDKQYTVVGRLDKTGGVIDRLILTSLDSVLAIHGMASIEHHTHSHDHDEGHHHHTGKDKIPEITAVLIQTKSPIANRNLPHIINQSRGLQAANPALEMTRLTSMLGVGTKTLNVISVILMVIACFSIFAGIAGTLENRKSDLAILRALGYSRVRVFLITAGEGMILALMGAIIGGVLSVLGGILLKQIMPSLSTSGASYHFVLEMVYVYAGTLFAGGIASAMPSYRAAKVDVAKQLG